MNRIDNTDIEIHIEVNTNLKILKYQLQYSNAFQGENHDIHLKARLNIRTSFV